jgi:hypothetical protein
MEIQIIQETCCHEECGIPFWLDIKYQARLVSTKRIFYCPNGHSQSYQGESDKAKIDRLIRERDQIRREKDIEIDRIKKECRKKKHGKHSRKI